MNLGVAWNRLGYFRDGILIPIVLAAMPNKHAALRFQLSDEILALHWRVNSASFRTPGIAPLVRSTYRSRRCACRSSNDSPCVQ